ncbi:ABC transporter ATP-binding protein [Paenibacillus sacheonensis]|uniref:ATP-binding cassette domain-containing protein n=1 Tax=Paenibacillus sacheonensis TaxID=742054 RepID=A0A7X5C069_9BACL|nr:ABC transporter ATP-binding protein [Paenibacillus sacheonensis]MBM7564392.1 ABC-type multidrug transport system fused ATPase/permease subunit [Paenibacillus sacheonensis]NBC68955.1 ATP-binding cassette domain-containing protein [Paenibacillus sacheonensis]
MNLAGVCLIEALVPLVLPMLIKFVLDAITNHDMKAVWKVSFLFAGVTAILCLLLPVFSYMFGKAVKKVMADLRLRLFEHVGKLPMGYFENTHSGESMSRMTNDLGVVEQAFNGSIRSLIAMIMTGGYAAVFMFLLDWRFALAMILLGFFITYVNTRFARPIRRISTDIQALTGKQLEMLTESIAGTQVIRMFQMSNRLLRRYMSSNDQMTALSVKRSAKNASLSSANYGLMWINNGGVFIAGSIMMINGYMTLGTMLSLILLLAEVTNLFRMLGSLWVDMQASLAGAARVFELLDSEEEPSRYACPADPVDYDPSNGIMELCNGTFGYAEEERSLDAIQFNVHQGQVVALVGPSGGGKSTLLKLLLGFYPLRQGEIRLQGKGMAEYTLSEFRDRIAYVPQESYLFDGTIAENIRYGRMDATIEEVEAAARAAHAHPFIMEQPDGYETRVGDRGARLSGGQKQRIAIARAILKDAPVLLLDEATASLDAESELAVHQGLQRLMAGRTTIAVAHRLSTIRHADVICVIDQGKIAEQGTHDQLLALGGVYKSLHDIQARNQGAGLGEGA